MQFHVYGKLLQLDPAAPGFLELNRYQRGGTITKREYLPERDFWPGENGWLPPATSDRIAKTAPDLASGIASGKTDQCGILAMCFCFLYFLSGDGIL